MNHPIPISNAAVDLSQIFAKISAGFPSPAADHAHKRIDLTEQLILHPDASFLFQVTGWSMKDAGIYDQDYILVDRAIDAVHGLIVLAVLDGEFTVKRLYKRGKVIRLMPENAEFEPIEIKEGNTLEIWGVVTFNVRRHFIPAKSKYAKAAA